MLGLDWNGLTDTLLSVQLFQSILLDDAPGFDDFVKEKVDSNLTFPMRRNFLNESLRFDALGSIKSMIGSDSKSNTAFDF